MRTRLSHQEANVQQQHKIRRQLEEMFEKEKNLLEIQTQQDKQTIQQLEVRLDIARRTIQDVKEAKAVAEKEWCQVINRFAHISLLCDTFAFNLDNFKFID